MHFFLYCLEGSSIISVQALLKHKNVRMRTEHWQRAPLPSRRTLKVLAPDRISLAMEECVAKVGLYAQLARSLLDFVEYGGQFTVSFMKFINNDFLPALEAILKKADTYKEIEEETRADRRRIILQLKEAAILCKTFIDDVVRLFSCRRTAQDQKRIQREIQAQGRIFLGLFYWLQDALRGTVLPCQRRNLRGLCDWFQDVRRCFEKTEQSYPVARSACRAVVDSATKGAEECAKNAGRARTRKIATQAVGGTLATGAVLAGAGTGVTLSIVAGVFTFGIGTVVGLGITAGATAAAGTAIGAGTGVATYFIADMFEKVEKNLREMAEEFNKVCSTSEAMTLELQEVSRVLCRVENDISHVRVQAVDYHQSRSLLNAVDKLFEFFDKSAVDFESCKDRMSETFDRIEQLEIKAPATKHI